MELRPYQHKLVDLVNQSITNGHSPCVVLPTGGGKTVITAELCKQALARGEDVLVAAHRLEIIRQLLTSLTRHLGEVPQLITAASTTPRKRITVAMVPTLTRRSSWIERLQGRTYILDECFPAGTPVDGTPIEAVRIGQMVRCLDEATGAVVRRPVTRLFKHPAPAAMVKLRLSDGTRLICTVNHPIWTDGQWIQAQHLTPGCRVMLATMQLPNVSGLLRNVRRSRLQDQSTARRRQETGLGVLRRYVRSGVQKLEQLTNRFPDQSETRITAYDRSQPDETGGSACQGINQPSDYGLEASSTGRQRQASASRATPAGVDAGLGDGSLGQDRARFEGWYGMAPLLQIGHWVPATQDRCGDRREQSLLPESSSTRSQEGRETCFAWVDSVEVQEQACAGGPTSMCPDGSVYNIEVAEHHNYFANGVLVHNCHHQVAPGYQKLREKLTPGRFIGMTATPITPTGGGLGKHFSELVLGPDPAWLMEHGFLCRYKLYGAPAEIDTTGVTIRAGEFALNELEERVTTVQGNVLRDWRKFNPDGKSTICVGISVQHAHSLADLFVVSGIAAAAVDGTTAAAERDRIFADFRSGAITVLCACAVVDEGLDVPEATCLQLLRPTRSLRLYRQLIGRVLRPAEGKEEAIIIDHSGSWRYLPLPDEHIDWSLKEKVKSAKAENRQVTRDPDDYIVAKREVIQEDNIRLQLVSTTASIEAKRMEARRRLHSQLRKVQNGIVPAAALWGQIKDARYFTEDELLAIQHAMNFPSDWAQTQGWLNV
jgi:superfamily II DNA or RNA helicase